MKKLGKVICGLSVLFILWGFLSWCDIVADNAALLAAGKDATFQNKVHLAMQAKGFGAEKDEGDGAK